MGKQYGCLYALDITRRDGPGIGCTDSQMHQACAALLQALITAALPHFGDGDDLTQMPHSVLMKIQAGGLAALQKHMRGTPAITAVKDIQQLIKDVQQQYDSYAQIPYADLVQDIIEFKLRRKR